MRLRREAVCGRTTCTASDTAKEDCVSFDTGRTTAYQEKNVWKIGDGPRTLFTFGVDRTEAENALAIIKQYGMNKSCFLGQPKPSFHYMLSGDSAPSGPFEGEVCKAIKPEAAHVQQTKTGWAIKEGERALIGFGERKAEADRALATIKKYGFTQFCLMATGKVDYMYMRK